MNLPKIVSRDEWLAARKRLLATEKDVTRDERPQLTAEPANRSRDPACPGDRLVAFLGRQPHFPATPRTRQRLNRAPGSRAGGDSQVSSWSISVGRLIRGEPENTAELEEQS